jgi:3-oxoacyl-[acyl-carrier-protein] synthase-3
VETDTEWILQRTGIRERRIADENTATSDIALAAARAALANAGVAPGDLDLIIVATVTPDHAFPATACLIQRELEAWGAAAFDLEAACTGFIYGLSIADQFIRTGTYRTVLVVAADILSKITDYTDRNTCILFGDGAGAAVLQGGEEPGLLALEIGADGRGGELLVQPAGGSRTPASAETVASRQHFIKMAGREVFKFAVKIMEESSLRVLEQAGLGPDDVDVLVPHQANLRIIDSACKRLGINQGKVLVNLDRYGNMSAASIPVALSEASALGKIKPGDNVLLVGFGGGLTWGAAAIQWK